LEERGKMKKIFIDTETTGLNYRKHDILQLSMLIEIDGDITKEFNEYSQPFHYDTIEEKSLKKNNLSIEQIKTFQTPKEMFDKFASTMKNSGIDRYNKDDKAVLIGYNIDFDFEFLRRFLYLNDYMFVSKEGKKRDVIDCYVNKYAIIDVLPLIRWAKHTGNIDVPNCKLETITKYFNIEHNPHNSLSDIKATRELYKICLDKFSWKK